MKKAFFIIVPILILVIGLVWFQKSNKNSGGTNEQFADHNLKSITTITHGHGLALTAENKLYIATHHGLLLLENDKDLYQVGDKEDDYMGFSPHPSDSKVFFSSGHPRDGGNIGFQKSEDGGFTWNKISNGISGPVDFHAMTVSPANPDLVFGSYQGAVQRSTDGGKNWEKFPVNFVIVNLAADPIDENIVYAASPQGLLVSKNKGQSWDMLLDPAKGGFISSVSIDPQNAQHLFVYSDQMGLIRSPDSGLSWTELKTDFAGGTPLYIAFNKNVPGTGYILTEMNSIYKTTDSGISWAKIR